ncbi:MAG: hypothetical protein CMD88_01085 [Gammaproteobacteria bacterium]|nr:hypothetical protein [Gammaproteobacteria bacterium]|tara:strand:+ start:130021 stop:131394 length:1374 start_codon:yes stop_codon:yes gene_type:complete
MILFGTDGIRGKFGKFPLIENEIRKIGYSIASILFPDKPGTIYISNDGRASADDIETALIDGINTHGSKTISLGMLHTPALSVIVNTLQDNLSAGIQITASHNPYHDNGIKIFNCDGLKISSKLEKDIEESFGKTSNIKKLKKTIQNLTNRSEEKKYIKMVRDYFDKKIKKINVNQNKNICVLIDCANGATSKIINKIFDNSCYKIITIFDKPNGKNINYNCGSTNPQFISNYINHFNTTNNTKIDLGVAFDGDGDRAIFVTKTGKIIDGDEILFVLSKYKKEHENYHQSVVGTNMTNFGIQSEYKKSEIDFIKTDVGDKYVLEGMFKHNAQIGGESSGHIIISDFIDIPVGDSILTLINILYILYVLEISLDNLVKNIKKTPSKLINIPVKDKLKFMKNKHNKEITNILESKIKGHGRILLRSSGTENLIRLLVEHPDEKQIDSLIDYFCDNIIKT